MRTREDVFDVLKVQLVDFPVSAALGLVPLELGKSSFLDQRVRLPRLRHRLLSIYSCSYGRVKPNVPILFYSE